MIALNQVRADLTLVETWCEGLHLASWAGLAGFCLELLGYAPLDFGAQSRSRSAPC